MSAVTKKGTESAKKSVKVHGKPFKKGYDPRRGNAGGRPPGHLSPVTVMKNILSEAAADGRSKLESICRDMLEDKPELAVKMAYGDIFGRAYTEKSDAETQLKWRSILDVAKTIFGDTYQLTPFHRWLLGKLNSFVIDYHLGLAPRMHLSIPSQHGKSEAVRMACALAMEMCGCKCAWASYNVTFAKKSSRMIRDWFTLHRPDLIGKDQSKAEQNWTLSNGAAFMATGPGSGLTGEAVDIMFIDDLTKNHEEYCSTARREKIKYFIRSVVATRIKNHVAVLSIGTRWGQDDAIESMMQEVIGNWQYYAIQAIPGYNVDTGKIGEIETPDPIGRKPGEALWESMQSADLLIEKMQRAGPLVAAAMYQSTPKQVTGNFFKRDKWESIIPDLDASKRSKMVRYWDLGFVEDGHNTAGALGYVGLNDMHSPLVVKDLLSFAEQWPVTKQRIIRQAGIDGKDVIIGIEANGTQISNFLEIYGELHPKGYQVIPRKSKPDKESDARAWQSLQWGGNVHIGTVDKLVDKSDRFPQADVDEVDAISGLFWLAKCYKNKAGGGYG